MTNPADELAAVKEALEQPVKKGPEQSITLVDPFDQLDAVRRGKSMGFFMKIKGARVEAHLE